MQFKMPARWVAAIGMIVFQAGTAGTAPAADPQTPVDQADPGNIGEDLQRQEMERAPERPVTSITRDQRVNVMLGEPVMVGAIRIDSPPEFPPSAFASVIDGYVGRPLSESELRALAQDIANVARKAGYGLATAWVPQQRLQTGILRVTLDLGSVDAIEASGDGAETVRRMLTPIATGRPVRTDELERQIMLARDVAGIWVGQVRLKRVGTRSILHVKTRLERVGARFYVDNWGTSTVGPVRARAYVDVNGMSGDDRLTLGAVVTPIDPGEFTLVSASYLKAIGTGGTDFSLSAYYGRSKPGGVLKSRDIEGRSVDAEAAFSHALIRRRSLSLWGNLTFGLRDVEQNVAERLVRSDRISTLSAGLYGNAKNSDSRMRARVTVTQGLAVLDATRAGDPKASRRDADGKFTKLEFWGEYRRTLGEQVSIQVQAEGQASTGPLLSSEEMGLGGRTFLRGYDYRERSGDRGIAGVVELRYDLKSAKRDFQVYGYADAGHVTNAGSGSGGGTLASAGVGVRAGITSAVEIGLELGIPLREGSDGKDPRLSFTLSSRF